MSLTISISTWKKVEFYAHEQHHGHLFRSNEFPEQWKWRGNIVFANSVEEARAFFEQQIRPHADYWERIGTGRFMWLVGWYRGAIYRHRSDLTLWKFKDFAFHAETKERAYEFLVERFGRLETA
jgi:hypothetical protein